MSDSETRTQARLVAGRYRLIREMGRGGMGVVWRAEDELVGRLVAVKEIRPPQGLSQADRETYGFRALTEARSVARIDHPGAVRLYDVLPATAADDAVYLIMELLEGPTLAQRVERDGPLPAHEAAELGLQLLSVLQAAHDLGIVHRDIKPSNIIVAAGGQAKLTDFGIAHKVGDPRLTRSGVMGTRAYVAPELFDEAPISPAADLWSLGATLYAAVQGRGPFDRETPGATLRAILVEDVPAAECEPLLAAAISGMLRRDPSDRATIGQARAQLQQAAAVTTATTSVTPVPDQPTPPDDTGTVKLPRRGPAVTRPDHEDDRATEPPPAYPVRSGHRRRNMLLVAGAAAALVAVAVVVPVLGLSGSSQPPARKHPHHGHSPAPVPSHTVRPAAPARAGILTDPVRQGVISVAFSPDGNVLAATNLDGHSIYLWDVATRSLTAKLTDPRGDIVYGVAFAPGGRKMAAVDTNGSIYLWDLATRRISGTLTNPGRDSGDSVAFSPDGKMLAVGDFSGKTYLWDVATRRLAATLTDKGHGQVQSVAFSPDGKMLAVVDDARAVYLWDVAAHRIIATLKGGPEGTGDPGSVAFSADGKLLAADGVDDVSVWDTVTGHLAATLPAPRGPGAEATSVAFSPHGRTLAVGGSNDTIYLWDLATRRITATMTDSRKVPAGVYQVAFSPDGTMLAVADGDHHIYLWRIS